MGRRTALLLAAVLLASCSSDPYPLPSGPPHAGLNAPAAVDEAVPGVVLFIQPRAATRVVLLAAEPLGVAEGASVEFFFSPPITQADGSYLVGERLLPLAGAVIETQSASPGPGEIVGIVARMTASKPGRYVLSAVRLRFTINGGPTQTRDGIDVVMTLCADDPKPADCPEQAAP